MTMSKKNRIILGVLGAAAAGALIAMLVAPEKSKKLGKQIRNIAGDWSDKLMHLVNDGKHEMEKATAKTKSEVNHLKSRAEESLGRM